MTTENPPELENASLLVVAGLPVMTALGVAFGWLGVTTLSDGQPLDARDWVGGAVFFGLSLVGLLVSARAAWRAWTKGAELHPLLRRLGRLVPLLALVGAAGGVWAGKALRARVVEIAVESAARWCQAPAALGFADEAACLAEAQACRVEGWRVGPEAAEAATRLRALMEQRRRDALAGGANDVRALEFLSDELRLEPDHPVTSAARRAGVVCLAGRGGVK